MVSFDFVQQLQQPGEQQLEVADESLKQEECYWTLEQSFVLMSHLKKAAKLRLMKTWKMDYWRTNYC